MKKYFKYIIIGFIIVLTFSCAEKLNAKNTEETFAKNNVEGLEYNILTKEEENIIVYKGTERAFSGKYNSFYEDGTYYCKRCNEPLFVSSDKFDSGTGWPSFDDAIDGAIREVPDGFNTEIVCDNCGAHLGHVFKGEGFSDKETRHCVNSLSLDFVSTENSNYQKAYFAGGCFWGVETLFEKQRGVINAVSGYSGGITKKPTYQDVLTGRSGHYETVEVTYDPHVVTFEDMAKFFFEIHDPTQANGQGPDLGEQYLSVVFYDSQEEQKTTFKLIDILKEKGYDVVTRVEPVTDFWEAEAYHQDYYEKNGKAPYCHFYTKKF